jgi:hypothetical protein
MCKCRPQICNAKIILNYLFPSHNVILFRPKMKLGEESSLQSEIQDCIHFHLDAAICDFNINLIYLYRVQKIISTLSLYPVATYAHMFPWFQGQ